MSKLEHAGASSTTPDGFASSYARSIATANVSASCTGTMSSSAARTSGFASPIATTAFARAFNGYGERVEKPEQVRAALLRGLDAVAKGQVALLDMTLEPINP